MRTSNLTATLSIASIAYAGCPPTDSNPNAQSCMNTTAENTCLFNYPGGQLLQTQFWDTDPAAGPAKSWTVHGLWPDNCDGSYQQYCDENRQYTNITQILESYNQTALLSYMRTYWADYHGQEESFWEHEWGKHGTCISTLDPKCYSNYQRQEEVVDFFITTVNLFKTLPTYTWLSNAGITPTTSKNYTKSAIESALAKPRNGYQASIQCSDGALSQVYYYFETRGTTQTGKFVPATPAGASSNCPDSIAYLPKQEDTAYATQTPTSSARPTATLKSGCRNMYN